MQQWSSQAELLYFPKKSKKYVYDQSSPISCILVKLRIESFMKQLTD